MNFMELICAICIFLIGHANAECTLPRGDVASWDKMSGDWYEVLNANSTYDDKMSCLSSYVTTRVKNGRDTIYVVGTGVFSNKKIIHRSLKLVDEDNGHYQVSFGKDTTFESLDALAEGNLVHDVEVIKDSDTTNINLDQTSLFTDHKSYIMQLMCGNSGDKNIWGFVRTKRPSVEQLLAFTNRLAKIGNGWSEVQLRLVLCNSY